MKASVCLAVLVALVLTSCRQQAPIASRDAYCHEVGNSKDYSFCLTTFIQILANPELYDGKRVLVYGWANETQGVVALFPSIDSMDSAELNSSILIERRDVDAYVGLEQVLQSSKDHRRRVQVGGVLHVNWPTREGAGRGPRFAKITQLEEFQ